GRTAWLNHGASRTRTGDLLGAIRPNRSLPGSFGLAQAQGGCIRSARFAQFGRPVCRRVECGVGRPDRLEADLAAPQARRRRIRDLLGSLLTTGNTAKVYCLQL